MQKLLKPVAVFEEPNSSLPLSPQPEAVTMLGCTVSGTVVGFLRNRYHYFRPIADYGISLIALIVAIPLFLVVAMITKTTSSGPVWASGGDDPRITRFGRFLRKTHMDELPQLINVLRGEMSLIGPRPERPFFADKFKVKIDGYTRRLHIKPGITGLAQCCYKYDETVNDVKRKLRYDVLYIKRMCWMLDMKILWKTMNVSLLGVKTS